MALFLSLSRIAFFAPTVNFSVACLIEKNVIVTDFAHLFHCLLQSYYNKRKTMPLLYFILKHFDPWSKVYTYNFRTRNHCRLIEWIIIMDYSLYSCSSKRSIICTLDLKHWSPNLFLYFPNNGHLSIMIIYPENAKPHRIATSLPATPYMKDNKSTVKPQHENLHAINLFY